MNKAEREAKILQSAARLFAEKRFDEVLMDEVAQKAGVGKGTLYRYFRNKEELYFAVVFGGIARLRERLGLGVSTEGNPLKKLAAALRAIVGFFSRNRFFFCLMAMEDSRVEGGKGSYRCRWARERRELAAGLVEILQRGAERGIFEIRHPHTEAQILLGMVRSTMRFNQEGLGSDEMVEEILRIFLRGVQRRTRGNP